MLSLLMYAGLPSVCNRMRGQYMLSRLRILESQVNAGRGLASGTIESQAV